MENHVEYEYPFTGYESYDKLVISFYIFRGVTCILLFIISLPQCYYEYDFLKKKKKSLFSPRLFTFISITMFVLFRALSSFSSLGFKDSRTGSLSWYFNVIGTCFLSSEWLYIGLYWMSILYTFFISDKIALNNIKLTFWTANIITSIGFLWTFSLMILNSQLSRERTKTISSQGFIVMVSLIGTFILVNGVILILYLKKQNTKSNTFRKSLGRTKRLATLLFILIVSMVIRNIVSSSLGIKSDSNQNYIFVLITYLIEIPQIIIVLTALGNAYDDDNNCWKYYLTFKKVIKESTIELPPDESFHSNINSNKINRNNSLIIEISNSNQSNNLNNSTSLSNESKNYSSGVNSSNSTYNNNDIEMNEIKDNI